MGPFSDPEDNAPYVGERKEQRGREAQFYRDWIEGEVSDGLQMQAAGLGIWSASVLHQIFTTRTHESMEIDGASAYQIANLHAHKLQ